MLGESLCIIFVSKTRKLGCTPSLISNTQKRVACAHRTCQRTITKKIQNESVCIVCICVYLYILTRYSCTGTPHAGPQVLGKTIFK